MLVLKPRRQDDIQKATHPQPPHKVGLSQWDLIGIKFRRNKIAVVAAVVLAIIIFMMVFASFLSPYSIGFKNQNWVYTPPMAVRIIHEGKLTRPYVYGYTFTVDPRSFLRIYSVDTTKRYDIRFLVHGEEWSFYGLFKTDIRLFGVDAPGSIFLLGTDRFGQDMWSRVLAGTQVTLSVGLIGVIISVCLGAVLGTLSGYYGGKVDMLLQRLIEFLQSFPNIPLWLTLAAALPPTWSSLRVYFGIVTILAFLGWTGMAREVRGKVLTMRGAEYTMAAKAAGASNWYIILRHMLPNALSHIIVVATLAVPAMILGESSLSFLGLGIQPPMTSLGVLLQEAQNVRSIANYPWLFTPALVIVASILAFNFLGDGLRDAADPYSQ